MGCEMGFKSSINDGLSTGVDLVKCSSEFTASFPVRAFGTPVPNSGGRGQIRAVSQAAAAVVGCQATLAAVSLRAAGTQALLGDVAQLLGLPEVQAGSFSSKSAAALGKIAATPAASFWQHQVR